MNNQFQIKDLEGLSLDARRAAMKTLLEGKEIGPAVRREIEELFLTEVLGANLDYDYIIKINGSREAKKRLVSLYLGKGRIPAAAQLVQEARLDELKEDTFSKLEQYALDNATEFADTISARMDRDQNTLSLLKMARQCNDEEANLALAKKFEEAGWRDEALWHYQQAHSHENAGRLYLLNGDKWHAALSYMDAGKNLDFALQVFLEDKHYENACRILRRQGRVEEMRKLAEEHGLNDLFSKLSKSKNKWVRKSLYERHAKRRASTPLGKIKAHDSGAYKTGDFLEICLRRKLVSPEIKKAIAGYLAENYSHEIYELERDDRPGDGGPPIPPSDWALKEAEKLRAKMPWLWTIAERYDKLAEQEPDYERKVDLYLQGGHRREAINCLNCLQRNYASNLEFDKARGIEERIKQLKEGKER